MKRVSLIVLIAAGSGAVAATALADSRSAATCAAILTADQKLIYNAVLPELTRDTDLFPLVRSKVMGLVREGRLQMSSAPDDAKVAGRCLQMVHQ